MDRQNMLWPTTGTGEDLARLLRDAANAGSNAMSGTVVENYLKWAGEQVRMLQGVLTPRDLGRLITTPRYWATVANPTPTAYVNNSALDELQHRVRLLEATAHAVEQEVAAWRPRNGAYTSLFVPDTNWWVEVDDNLNTLDWHNVLRSNPGPSAPSLCDEVRVIVPLLVIDELDGLTHRHGALRDKVANVTKYLYHLLGNHPGYLHELRAEADGRGEVNIQLLLEPLSHGRLTNSDDELVNQVITLREFIGHPDRQTYFVTHDAGAAFRASNAGLMVRHLPLKKR